MKKYIVLGMTALALALGGCKWEGGDSKETRQTMKLMEQASVTVGVPAIKNFTEKRQLKMIYELRDQSNLVTYTYTIDLQGRRHKVCPSTSVGYGIPFAAQFTAAKAPRVVYPMYPSGETTTTGINQLMDQPEPNGLYMPSSADSTWVLCLDPKTKKVLPVYVEPKIVVYPFEMSSVD